MKRDHERILISNKKGKGYLDPINRFNEKYKLFGIDTLPIGEKTLWPFGAYQTEHDLRRKQMRNGTILKTYKGHNSTSKRFKIRRISRGKIYGVPEKFSKYIMLLERVF